MVNQTTFENIKHATPCPPELPPIDTTSLIEQLGDVDGFIRMHAREILICTGKPAIPQLLYALTSSQSQLRWQIIKVLEGIQDPASAAALVSCLKDDNAGVRWAASDALIHLRRGALVPLFRALVLDYDSLWLRQGAHHILHIFRDAGALNPDELAVFDALEGIEPTASVPWAAEKALEPHT